MSSDHSNLPMDQIPERPSENDPEISEFRIRRKCEQGLQQSYFTTLTAFTIAATCLVSSAAAFTSTRTNGVLDKAFLHPTSPGMRSAPLRPFGSHVQSTSSAPSTRLFASSDPSSDKAEWRGLLKAFQMYKAAYGDLRVPTRFIVPSMPPWPEAAWGMKLGHKVGQIRSTGKFIDNNQRRREKLDRLGFIWRVRAETKATDSSDIPFDQIYDALVVYQKVFKIQGALTVPLQFTVPESYPWPGNTRGLPLGSCIEKIRTKSFLKNHPGAEEKLTKIGFQVDTKVAANDIRFQNVFDGLKRYKEIYGDLLVPQPFEVPDKSSDWPAETWGLRLGARVNAIRSQGTFVNTSPERRQMLDDLGFVWSPPESERRKRGRKSKAEKELEEKEQLEADALKVAAFRRSEPETERREEAPELDSFVSSFDFSSISSDVDGEESISPTWGLEGGREFQDVVAAAKEEAAQQAAQDDYKPPRTLAESLSEAKERAIACGVIQEG
jgi:hypothetical protein